MTHDIALARHAGDRIAFLHQGRFTFLGGWDEVDESADPLLADFLAGREDEDRAA